MCTLQANPTILEMLEARGLKFEWCCSAVRDPVFGYREVQDDNCVRVWTQIPDCDRYIRVVVFPNGAFRTARFDRNFRKRVHRGEIRQHPLAQ
jgi:hypothetical protein